MPSLIDPNRFFAPIVTSTYEAASTTSLSSIPQPVTWTTTVVTSDGTKTITSTSGIAADGTVLTSVPLELGRLTKLASQLLIELQAQTELKRAHELNDEFHLAYMRELRINYLRRTLENLYIEDKFYVLK